MKGFIFGLVALILSSSAYSEHFWFTTGGGFSNSGFNTGVTLNFAKDGKLYLLGGTASERDFLSRQDGILYEEIYAAYGMHESTQWTSMNFSVGLGAFKERYNLDCDTSGLFDTDCDRNTKSVVVGIPIDITGTFGKYAGIGVSFHANINEIRPTVALRMTYSFGVFN